MTFDKDVTVPPWAFYLLEVAIGTLLVSLAQKFLRPGTVNKYLEEFLCVMVTIVISHENSILKRAYGDAAYYLAVFGTTVLYAKLFRPSIFTNAAGAVYQFTSKRDMSDIELGTHISIQIFAAWCAFRVVQFIWQFHLCGAYHEQKLMTINTCSSHIAVGIITAIMIEFCITFIFRLVAHGEKYLPFGNIWTGLAAAACTYAGYSYTGGYFNPSLAFSMQYNCRGHYNWEFFAVYFLGPVIAAYLVGTYGDLTWKTLREPTNLRKAKTK